MKTSAITVPLGLAFTFGIIFYAFYHSSTVGPGKPAVSKPVGSATLQASAQQPTLGTEPPPPAVPISGPTYQPRPEPSRVLIGATKEQLGEIEQYLPPGARVVTYPVSETEERAAYAASDLDHDGKKETVVVYKAPGTGANGENQTLFLAVLKLEGNTLTLSASARLFGVLIYSNIYDKRGVPFGIRDVTGDGQPKIIVTSGEGASLGGALQIYSFDESSLHQIAFTDGHTFRIYQRGAGKADEITAQGRYEDKARIYRWNGQKFEQINASGKL